MVMDMDIIALFVLILITMIMIVLSICSNASNIDNDVADNAMLDKDEKTQGLSKHLETSGLR